MRVRPSAERPSDESESRLVESLNFARGCSFRTAVLGPSAPGPGVSGLSGGSGRLHVAWNNDDWELLGETVRGALPRGLAL